MTLSSGPLKSEKDIQDVLLFFKSLTSHIVYSWLTAPVPKYIVQAYHCQEESIMGKKPQLVFVIFLHPVVQPLEVILNWLVPGTLEVAATQTRTHTPMQP